MKKLRELELEVVSAEENRDSVAERYSLIQDDYMVIKREYSRLYDLKLEKENKLFEARKTLFYYQEGLKSK